MIPQTQPKVKYLPKIVALLRGCNFSLRPRMHRFSTGYGDLVGIPYVVALIAATSKRQSFQQSALFQRPSADTEKNPRVQSVLICILQHTHRLLSQYFPTYPELRVARFRPARICVHHGCYFFPVALVSNPHCFVPFTTILLQCY